MVKPEFRPFDFTVDGADNYAVTSSGKKFIDFSGSAMTTGYNYIKKEWLLPVVSRLVYDNPHTQELSAKLTGMSGFEHVAFTTSGTEACDASLSRYGKPFFSLEGAYHGLTYITSLVSNGTGYDGNNRIVHLKCPTSRITTEAAISWNEEMLGKIPRKDPLEKGSVIIELIQSDGGVNVIPLEFTRYINEITERYGLKLIVDEVYTGYGRSGEMLLFKKYGLEPDIVCLGKGMAAGLPLGAVLYSGDWDTPYNSVISMQSANMFVAKVAVEVLKSLDDRRLNFVRISGQEIIKRLSLLNNTRIFSVRGMGFMIGIEFRDRMDNPDTKYAYSVREKLARSGLICSLTGEFNNVLKITPPPLIDKDTLMKGVAIIENVLSNSE
jgi:4-aminobutyrate aminotransferase-like enzyme